MIQRTLLFTVMVLCPIDLAWADDWPQWKGSDRTGVSREKSLLKSWPAEGPKLLWTFDLGFGLSGMSVVGDRLYTMGAEGDVDAGGKEYVYAIDLKTRKRLWSVAVGPRCNNGSSVSGPSSTPTIDGNFLYAIGGLGNLVCVDTAKGKKVWTQHLVKDLDGVWPSDTYTESPLVDGNLVLATPGGKKGAIAAFDKKTGALKWRSTDFTTSHGNNCNASMIAIKAGGVRQYVQTFWGGSVAGVRASDGKLLWQAEAGANYCYCTPVYKNDCVYISTEKGCKLFKLIPDGDKFETEEIYANQELCVDCGGFVRVGEYVYGYARWKGWVCQEFKTGKQVWLEKPGKDMGDGSVIYADGSLYCYHERKGDMLLLKATPDGYQEQGKFRIPQEPKNKFPRTKHTYPVVANGKLYLRNHDLIFCYDIHKPQ